MELDENKKREIYLLGHETVKMPTLGLVAKCYELLSASFPEASMQPNAFQQLFKDIVIGEEGINFLTYDQCDNVYYICDMTNIEITKIDREDQPIDPERNPWGNPLFNINSRIYLGVRYGGSGEELYDNSELIRLYISRGWRELDPRFSKPVGHLSPYDLCALGNLTELGNRMARFIKYMMEYRSSYQQYMWDKDIVVVDKEEIMCSSLYYNLAMNYFATIVRLPDDQEAMKHYLTRAFVLFHETPVRDAMIQDGDVDLSNAYMILKDDIPEIRFALLTSSF